MRVQKYQGRRGGLKVCSSIGVQGELEEFIPKARKDPWSQGHGVRRRKNTDTASELIKPLGLPDAICGAPEEGVRHKVIDLFRSDDATAQPILLLHHRRTR